jgi:hypothetical protein
MNAAAVRFIGASTGAEAIRAKVAGIEIERGDLVLRSRLAPDQPLNDHLVWLWMTLKQQRRYLKSLQLQGIRMICECAVPRGSIHILPNSAEMLHLLGIELVIDAS